MPREDEDVTQPEEAPKPAPARTKPKGVGSPPDDAPRDADLLWEWLLEDISKRGISPYQIRISVVQEEPVDPMTRRAFQVGSFDGGPVVGTDTLSAGQALVNRIMNVYHLPRASTRMGARYSVRFQWATNTQNIKRGELVLPPHAEIAAIRNAEHPQETGAGAPPNRDPAMPPAAPPYYPPQPPYGFGYPSQPPPGDAMAMPMMMQMMQEMFRAAMEHRPPVIPEGWTPPGVGMSQPVAAPPVNEDAIVAKVTAGVLGALKNLGVLDKPTPTVAAPPPAPAPKTGLEGLIQGAIEKVVTSATQEFTSQIGQTLKARAGIGTPRGRRRYYDDEDALPQGAPAATGVAAPPPAPEPPPDPADALPWTATAVPEAKWDGGRPVVYAENKETGKIDLLGSIMSNPIVIEKGMEVGLGLMQAVKGAVERIAAPAVAGLGKQPAPATLPEGEQKPEVVAETPPDAVDAGQPAWR